MTAAKNKKKKRNSAVSADVFRQQIAEIRKEFRALGNRIRFRNLAPHFASDGGAKIGIEGFYSPQLKKASVTCWGRMGRALVLFVAFHELRHAQHVKSGAYRSYYLRKHGEFWDFLNGYRRRPPKNYPRPRWHAHWWAERDCDRYAMRRLKKLGIAFKPRPYPKEMVFTYLLSQQWPLYYRKRK